VGGYDRLVVMWRGGEGASWKMFTWKTGRWSVGKWVVRTGGACRWLRIMVSMVLTLRALIPVFVSK
jgi:hypothetical protein